MRDELEEKVDISARQIEALKKSKIRVEMAMESIEARLDKLSLNELG